MKAKRPKKPLDRKRFVIASLRRASYRWPARTEAKNAARIERGLYQCNICRQCFGPKEISLDHIKPVVDPSTGFTTIDEYAERLLCDANGFQVLCDICHDSKTQIENQLRKLKRSKKAKKSK